jgi:ATP-dependent Lhr-like helicase
MHDNLTDWFRREIGEPYDFQRRTWEASESGRSGLVHVPTGAGKTYAAYLPSLSRAAETTGERGLEVLYVSPLRAMTRDLKKALSRPIDDLGLDLTVETRTGDTKSSVRRRQKSSLPKVLLTTPESLSLLLTYANARDLFGGVGTIIVDEWHELIDSKRGTQTELCLARLRRWATRDRDTPPQTWALTATLSNTTEAARAACGPTNDPLVVRSDLERPVHISSALPDDIDAFPWYGNLGLTMLDPVLEEIRKGDSTLVFTNTRSQAERWFRAILDARPELAGRIGLHHGSVDRSEREFVEEGLKSGDFDVVVATSSLDLGVDFAPLDRVIQIGSVKGIARLVQRAGRSGHRPGEACRVLCVPTYALQLFEFAAARRAVESGELEPRQPPNKPLDVLIQHMVTCALGGGFTPDALFEEVTDTVGYGDLTRSEFDRALKLAEHGGDALESYDFYQRIERDGERRIVESRRTGIQHRTTIGTITSDPAIEVRYTNNHRLGTVEESFISKVKKGERFIFAGKLLELVKIKDLTAYVKKADGSPTQIPRWMGGRLPISTSLSAALRRTFGAIRAGEFEAPELDAAAPILEAQRELSGLPGQDSTLCEILETDEGHHLFVYPFEGRLVHEGLAALLALRMSRHKQMTFALSANEYGVELLAPEPFPWRRYLDEDESLFSADNLAEDARESINMGELAKRQFRGVARVAGLVFEGYPGSRKTQSQLQTSSGLLYDVFRKWDPENLLLQQARREVLETHFEQSRLAATLNRISNGEVEIHDVRRPTPLGFPLLVERINARLSNESLRDRIERMKEMWTTA